jgi:hypothetical protein
LLFAPLEGSVLLPPESHAYLLQRLEVLLPRLAELYKMECDAVAQEREDTPGAEAAPAAGGETAGVSSAPASTTSAAGDVSEGATEPPPRVPADYKFDIGDSDMPSAWRTKFEEMLRRKDLAFSLTKDQLGCMKQAEFQVGVNPETKSVWTGKRRLPEAHEAELKRVVAELTQFGFIVEAPDDCQFASPVLMVPKRDSLGKITLLRMCVDYRAVNAHTPPHRHPMPLPEEMFVKCANWNMYSSGDLLAGFHQARVAEADRPKTAFHGPTSLMMYTRAPFGLKRMPNWFQCEMERIMGDTGMVFVDDLLTGNDVAADYSNFQEHIDTVERMLDRLILFGVTLNPDKCHWAKRRIKFLGHILTPGSIRMENGKVDAILQIARPTTVAELLSWIHTVGYYSKLLDHFSARSEPLPSMPARADRPAGCCHPGSPRARTAPASSPAARPAAPNATAPAECCRQRPHRSLRGCGCGSQ